jgi:hypothetical protein
MPRCVFCLEQLINQHANESFYVHPPDSCCGVYAVNKTSSVGYGSFLAPIAATPWAYTYVGPISIYTPCITYTLLYCIREHHCKSAVYSV